MLFLVHVISTISDSLHLLNDDLLSSRWTVLQKLRQRFSAFSLKTILPKIFREMRRHFPVFRFNFTTTTPVKFENPPLLLRLGGLLSTLIRH